jgi:hypothetical protein
VTSPPLFNPPTKNLTQVLLWTALPQGTLPGAANTVRLSVLVTPQLSFEESVGFRTETSTELATFPDWVNWPDTVANPSSPISFSVFFNVNGVTTSVDAAPDLSVLRPDCWAAMFGPTTTRVDSYGFEDFTKVAGRTSFDAVALHSHIQNTYNTFTAGVATTNAAASSNTPYVDPSKFDLLTRPADLIATPANVSATSVLNPPMPAMDALAFHQAATNNTSIGAPSVPILDFHAALSSLGHFPEMLRYFGLLFPLVVTLPSGITPRDFTVAVVPTWTSLDTDIMTKNGSLATRCSIATGNFLSVPMDQTLYSNGALNLANTDSFNFVDVDVDRATQSLNNLSRNLVSTRALHLPPGGAPTPPPAGAPTTTLNYALPALRGVGPSLIWTGWGQEENGLDALATSQAAINAGVTSWLATGNSPILPSPILTTEDITRGWRIDVADVTLGKSNTWYSLHWRQATFVFGAEGTPQITVSDPTPFEGMVTPAISHSPFETSIPSTTIFVHEMITRWAGWSLSAPKPGGQVNDDGSVQSTAAGNPAVPTSYVDEFGNYNPQISATFASPHRSITVVDPVSHETIGMTGLPPLRYGHTYQFGARAVDLGGWSVPQGQGIHSPALNHSRWEPVKAPLSLPIAPLTPGEGVHTVVVRDDGVHTVTANARWLFPPRVHQLLAEEHGQFDHGAFLDPSQYDVILNNNDGSLTTLKGAVIDESLGTPHVILPSHLPVPVSSTIKGTEFPKAPTVTWLPDPASFGYALYFESPPGFEPLISSVFTGTTPFTSFNTDIGGLPNPSPVYTDQWIVADEIEGDVGQWPLVKGKLLVLWPVSASSSESVHPGGTTTLPSGVVVPGVIADTKITESPDIVAISAVPGSVYTVRLSSIFPPSYATAAKAAAAAGTSDNSGNVLGLLPELVNALHGVVAETQELFSLLLGQIPQVTPYHTVQFVYAVLIPLTEPKFSGDVQFIRQPNDITVAITDSDYALDVSTTSTVTYMATWIDPLDNPADPTNDPTTASTTVRQNSLVVTVENIYDMAIAADPLVPVAPAPPQSSMPFGAVTRGTRTTKGVTVPVNLFSATHRIGDTKHHLVTYTPTAATRFGQFFAETITLTLTGTTPSLIDSRGIDVNLVKVTVASTGAVVAQSNYSLNGKTGEMTLVLQPPAHDRGNPNPYSGVPLAITYVPTDTRGGPLYQVHIPSTTAPPPIKVVKVAPAWSLTSTGTPGSSSYSFKRTGNTLRVYMERPWYVTGANEMVGVLTQAFGISDASTSGVNIDDISLLALDPISVGAPSGGFSQTRLSFVTPNGVPKSGGFHTDNYPQPGGNPVLTPSVLDPDANLYNIWAYEPNFDATTNLWYVDIQLAMDAFTDNPPPGYFLRLALARYQPYSIQSATTADPTDNKYLSPTTLVTYAQPVPDRSISVVNDGSGFVLVTVSGPGYYGWRPAPANDPLNHHDIYNTDARHPNSDGKGANTTSTMLVEVQEFSDVDGFTGDFGWKSRAGAVALVPHFSGTSIVEWNCVNANGPQPIDVSASDGQQLRLRISELDYYSTADQGVPTTADTSFRRPFVAHIPL